MQKKAHVLLLSFMLLLMAYVATETTARPSTSLPPAGMENVAKGSEAFFSPESPFFFFTPDYIAPLSSAVGTAPGVPGAACGETCVLPACLACCCGGKDAVCPGTGRRLPAHAGAARGYYVLALRRIVV